MGERQDQILHRQYNILPPPQKKTKVFSYIVTPNNLKLIIEYYLMLDPLSIPKYIQTMLCNISTVLNAFLVML